MKPHYMAALLLFVLTALASENALSGETLRWRFSAGQQLRVRRERASETTFQTGEHNRVKKERFAVEEIFRVEDVDSSGTARLRSRFDRIEIRIDSPDGEVLLDVDTSKSTDRLPDEAALEVELLKKIVNAFSAQITIDNRGQILQVTLTRGDADEWTPMLPGWSERLSEEGVTRSLKQIFPVLPEKPLVAGDTWVSKLKLNRPSDDGLVEAEVKHRFVGSTDNDGTRVAKIVTNATLDQEPARVPAGVIVNVISQDTSGVILFNNTAGLLGSIENTQESTVEYSRQDQVGVVRVDSRDTSRIAVTASAPPAAVDESQE